MSSSVPSRPVGRYHGGKWRLAPWIISHMRPHRTYVEAFSGMASVLLRKERVYSEVINDVDGEVVNLFSVLRSGDAGRLVSMVELTPFASAEFDLSYEPASEPLEQARRTLFRMAAGHGASNNTSAWKTGFRRNTKRAYTTPASDWKSYPGALAGVIERLRGVVVENMPAIELVKVHDHDDALIYMDPPYMAETRGRHKRTGYKHEMSDADHEELLSSALNLRCGCVLSGYRSEMYDDMLSSWTRIDRAARGDGAVERVESIWLNYSPQMSLPLFNSCEVANAR